MAPRPPSSSRAAALDDDDDPFDQVPRHALSKKAARAAKRSSEAVPLEEDQSEALDQIARERPQADKSKSRTRCTGPSTSAAACTRDKANPAANRKPAGGGLPYGGRRVPRAYGLSLIHI